jgi:hypothetical protein
MDWSWLHSLAQWQFWIFCLLLYSCEPRHVFSTCTEKTRH